MKTSVSLSIIFLLLARGAAWAETVDAGQTLYQESCAGCHGATGAGGGELGALLNIEPPKLTTLSARNEGKFPMLEVIHIIDGRSGIRAHGGSMPVFGSLYSASGRGRTDDYGAVIEVRGRVMSIALYLESIQE